MIERLLEAVARRAALGLHAEVLRLVDDAADGCAGIVLDRFGPVLRLELYRAAFPPDVEAWAAALATCTRAEHVVGVLRRAQGKTEMRVLFGRPPAAHVVHEASVRLLVRTCEEDAAGAGVFVDQRLGRALVRARAPGKVVLNLFAHAGAFGAVAVVGGAARVDHVDAARKCARWAALNIALNGHDPRRHRFLVEDALLVLSRAARRADKEGPAHDIIVCDPPTTAVRPDGTRFHVERHLGELARDAFRALRPGGTLLLSSNNRALSVDAVRAHAVDAARHARRTLKSVDELPLPADLPSAADPQLRPMRGVVATLDDEN